VSRRRVFFYVQHLLGIGHLRRAATLARALAQAQLEVTLASGGSAAPNLRLDDVRFLQLPPAAAADASFRTLVDGDGRPVDEAWRRARCEALLRAYRDAEPDLLLVELFPFGRRQMRFELLPLLDAAHGARRPPLVVCSVRDVLAANLAKPGREDEALALFERYFDRLLVHGDPALIGLEQSLRLAPRIAARLHYTGYVVERSGETAGDAGRGEVLVSAGGGAVGRRLLRTALEARPLCALREQPWRLLAGPYAAQEEFEALRERAAADRTRVIVERERADFTTLLKNCALSVSQAGYNTVMETLDAGARAVLVPFSGGAETEQAARARLLAARGLVELLEESALDPAALAAAIDRAAARPAPRAHGIDLEGARRSAELVAHWLKDRA
jgi:predicted glycosyltransferase